MNKKLVIILSIALSTIIILFLLREVIPKQMYMIQVNKLARKISVDDRINYREDLHYTMNKFWSSHRQRLTTRNDLNEVMDRLNALNRKETVDKDEIFDFIDYVSDIYTTAIIKRNDESSAQKTKISFD
ncbi:hypothetical protein J7M07_02490 [bacterium]|nr:hypothetical protein [bacterium]